MFVIKSNRFYLKEIALCILLFVNISKLWAQNATDKNKSPYIQWVGQFPSTEKKSKDKGLTKRIGRIIFGKEPLVISKPFNVLAINLQEYWILDQGSGNMIQVKKNTAEIPKFISKQLKGFNSLVGICLLNNGSILFTDSYLSNIYKINFDKKTISLLNDLLKLKQPTGIAYSELNDEIWVVETGAHQISVLNAKGEIIKKIGRRGNGNGEFNFPTFIWIDKQGNVYIVDSMNFRVQIFDKNGKFVSTFGQIGDATGYMARPKGIATDTYGNIYIADALFHVVQVFDKLGNFLYRFGEQGQGKGQFWMPTGIFIDDENYIYVADSYNSRIQIFQLVKED